MRGLLALLTFLSAGGATGVSAAGAAPDDTGYQVQGTAVTGAASPTSAPRLVPGQYTDTLADAGAGLGQDGTVRYYEITLRSGDTPYVVATLVRPGGATDDMLTVSIEMGVVEDGEISSCTTDDQDSIDTFSGPFDAATAVVSPGQVGGADWPESCPAGGGTFTIAVTRVGDAYAGRAARLELGVRIEPPADATGLPAAASSAAVNVQPDPGSRLSAVRGGSSYNDATTLTRGTYRDQVTAGQTRYYRVRLTWGQRLAFSLSALQRSGTADSGLTGGIVLINPLRQELRLATRSDASGLSFSSSLSGSSAAPVRWINRTSEDAQLVPYSVSGDYYLLVTTMAPAVGKAAATLTYTLQLQVLGPRERGPVYGPGTADATGTPQASGGDGSSFGLGTVLIVGGAVVVLAAMAAMAVFVLRRRQVRPSSATRTFRT